MYIKKNAIISVHGKRDYSKELLRETDLGEYVVRSIVSDIYSDIELRICLLCYVSQYCG